MNIGMVSAVMMMMMMTTSESGKLAPPGEQPRRIPSTSKAVIKGKKPGL
jgi:hypothetical protein